jgi:hypothetical protein
VSVNAGADSTFAFIGGWTIDRRDFFSVQPQIHSQLPAMVRHVVEHAVADRYIALLARASACLRPARATWF